MAITATFVRGELDGWRGDARLYRLSKPVRYEDGRTDHVVVSAVNVAFSGPETYIFPAKPDGTAIDFGSMKGSFRGDLNHRRAIKNAGWTLVEQSEK
jgi:hypothetical protein